MAKILISFIGTGQLNNNNNAQRVYTKANYQIENQQYATSFVAKALFEHLKADNLYLLGTVKSMWEEVYNTFLEKEKIDENYWVQLGEFAQKVNKDTNIETAKELFKKLEEALPNTSKIFLLRYGLNEQELWQNFQTFNTVFEHLEDGDEIFLDITHAFRSLPMFALMSIFYLQDVIGKKINIRGIYYGMLDVMRETDGIAQVVNLQPIVEMSQWLKAGQQFSKYGISYEMLPLIENDQVKKKLSEFSNFLQLNYINEIGSQISQLTSIQQDVKNLNTPAQLVIKPTLEKFTKHFKNKNTLSQKQLALAEWHFQNANYGFAYINLVEAIISYVCECENMDVNNETNRKTAKDKIHKESGYASLLSIYGAANDIRKKIAHAIPSSSVNKEKDITDLQGYFKKLKEILQ
ncbi:MAG: TIGR02221 family CRISPR-associated protein [Thermonemataceae bacterium]|nr:TIGR02221 family CRISPR-associated protein [Thermonemataceae bacterium]